MTKSVIKPTEDLVNKIRSETQIDLSLPLDKDIKEFEEAAQEMLERMDIMLATVRGVNSKSDPGKRLEVN